VGTVTDKIFQNLKNIKFENLLCGFGEIEKILVTSPQNLDFETSTYQPKPQREHERVTLLKTSYVYLGE